MEQTPKKQWQKPELIVLVRSKPEEAVLEICKTLGPSGASSDSVASGCLWYTAFCGLCSSWADS